MRLAEVCAALLIVLAAEGCAVRSFVAQPPVPLAADLTTKADARFAQWLGTNAWIISRGPDVVVVDPFFSRPALGAVIAPFAWGPFLPDPERIDAVLPRLPTATAFVLIGHAHYDHLMDVVHYLRRTPRDGALYVGTPTAFNILSGYESTEAGKGIGLAGRFWKVGVDTDPPIPSPQQRRIGAIRVTAFPSDHAPHALGYEAMSGRVVTPRTAPPARPGDYRDGWAQMYFIDFYDGKDSNTIVWRVFVNGAASTPQHVYALRLAGAFLQEHRTDVAVVCVPGWNKVRDYPESVIEAVNPEHVVLSHYDNFFAPYVNGEDPENEMEFVMLADYHGFVKRIEQLRGKHSFRLHQPRTGECLFFPGPTATRDEPTLPCERAR